MPDLSPQWSREKKIGVTAEHLSSSQVLPEDAIQDTSEKTFRGAHLLSVRRRRRCFYVMDARARERKRETRLL